MPYKHKRPKNAPPRCARCPHHKHDHLLLAPKRCLAIKGLCKCPGYEPRPVHTARSCG